MDQFNRRAFLARASLFGAFVSAGVAFPGALNGSLGAVGRANAQGTGSAVLDATVTSARFVTQSGTPDPLCQRIFPSESRSRAGGASTR